MNKAKFFPIILICLLLLFFVYGLILQLGSLNQVVNGESILIENPLLFFSGLVSGILAIYLIVRYFRKENRIKRTIMHEKQTSIKDVANGEVAKVIGKVMPVQTPMIAPLSGKKCVFYQAIIEEIDGNLDTIHYNTLIEEKEFCDVFISDGTGLVEIKPDQAIISIKPDLKKGTGYFKNMDERMKLFLEKHNLDASKFLGINPSYRFQEGMLEIGEEVAVLGQAKWTETSNQDFQKDYPKSLTFAHNSQNPLYISDEPETF